MKKRILIYLAVFVIALMATITYAIADKPADGADVITSKENTKDYVLEKYKDGFVTYNGTDLIHYNVKMEQKWVCAIGEPEAELYVKGDYIIISADGKDKVILVKNGNIRSEIKTEKKLINASVNENGYVTVMTSDKGYKGQCFVYSENGENLAEFSFGERYVLGAYLLSDNRTLAINTVIDRDESFDGEILIADIKSGETKNIIAKGGIYTYVNAFSDKVLAINGDTLYCYDKKGREKWSNTCGTDVLNLNVSGKYISVVSKNGSFGGNDILTFNLSGRLLGKYSSDFQIMAFDSSNGYSAVLANGEILLVNKRGKVAGSTEGDSNVKEIKLYEDANKVLILTEKATMKKISK